jgi:hypothetical protein
MNILNKNGENIEDKGINTFAMYLDYVNNFITLEAFANHYGLTVDMAGKLIDHERGIAF